MDFEFRDGDLEEVYYSPKASIGHGPLVDKGFRKLIQKIAAASNEFDLRALKGLHYHQLDGKRKHQHGLNIDSQWRLVVERVQKNGRTCLLVISVEDYH